MMNLLMRRLQRTGAPAHRLCACAGLAAILFSCAGTAGAQTYNWVLSGSADWNVAADWTPTGPPNGSAVDAVDALASSVFEFSSGDTYAVNSFTDAGGLSMTGGMLTANSITVSGTFGFSGGTIDDAAITGSSSMVFGSGRNNILSGVALDDGLNSFSKAERCLSVKFPGDFSQRYLLRRSVASFCLVSARFSARLV